MLYLKDQVFENLVVFELGRWSTEYGSNRAPREQLLNGRIWDACQKYQIKNMLALFAYGVTETLWFSTVARDREGQIKWAEKIAEEFAKVGDIRLMSGLTLEDIRTMELVWKQAASRLDTYVANKKPVEPKLPTKPEPIPVGEKKEEPKVEGQKEPSKPVDPIKEGPKKVEEPKKSNTRKVIGNIATGLALVVAWLPIPPPVKAVAKILLNAIASIFK